MKYVLVLIAATAMICPNAFGQLEKKIKDEWVVPGTITRDGKVIEGYIKKMGTTSLSSNEIVPAPWEFQKSIRFIEKSKFESLEKVKNKDYEKLEAADLTAYTYQNDSLKFEGVKYADMSAVGTGMIPKKMFMRKISEGKISMFMHYSNPPSMGEVSVMDEETRACAEPNMVYRVGADGKLKLVNALNVSKELSDCPDVVKKFEAGEYKSSLLPGDGKFAKFMNKTLFKDEVKMLVIDDYNMTCK